MSDLVERLREYASDDHERLCDGRCYSCSCGYDDKRDPLLLQAATRIAQLEAALRAAYEVYAGSDGFVPETCAEGYQRQIITQMVGCISAALEERT